VIDADTAKGAQQDYLDSEDAITNALLGKKYIASMYWAFTTMTTVGYGDISAVTMSERIFAMLGMLVGGFVFSALIGTISHLFESRDLSKLAKHRGSTLCQHLYAILRCRSSCDCKFWASSESKMFAPTTNESSCNKCHTRSDTTFSDTATVT